jgi:hypothetical protein
MMLVLGAGGKAGVHGSLTQYRIAGITPATVKSYILNEMAAAISGSNWEASYTLLAMARAIENPKVKADVLNGLLVMHWHELHQEVTMEVQRLKSTSSVSYIRSVLGGGFHFLAYTCAEDEVIAKWFSHALAKIGTPEAIEVIKEFSVAGNAGIAEEMRYRLEKLAMGR